MAKSISRRDVLRSLTIGITAGSVLGTILAGVVKGRTMTAWPTIQGDLEKVGATVVDRDVVVDRNLVTSRKPDDIPAFVRESLALLEQRARSAA